MALQGLGRGFLRGQEIITVTLSVCSALVSPDLINPFWATQITQGWGQS